MYDSLIEKMRLPFIDSDLLYRGTLQGRFDCIYNLNHFTFRYWDGWVKKHLKKFKSTLNTQNVYISECEW